jgi:hypothetical protein
MGVQVTSFVKENALFLLVLLGLIAGFFLLRTRGTDLDSLDEFDAVIAAGQPVVVEFYSNT